MSTNKRRPRRQDVAQMNLYARDVSAVPPCSDDVPAPGVSTGVHELLEEFINTARPGDLAAAMADATNEMARKETVRLLQNAIEQLAVKRDRVGASLAKFHTAAERGAYRHGISDAITLLGSMALMAGAPDTFGGGRART
jgi:hypothetical protein